MKSCRKERHQTKLVDVIVAICMIFYGTRMVYLNIYIKKKACFKISPLGEWADPGGTAIPGQPVEKLEQAPKSSPKSKNQFNIEVPHWGTYQILS